MICDFHVHTKYSFDSRSDIKNMIKVCERREIGCIAITDHDTLIGVEKAKISNKVSVISGCEITADDGSHVIGLFIEQIPRSRTPMDIIESIKTQGGLVLIPHPFKVYTGLFRAMSDAKMREIIKKSDMFEIHNSKCTTEENAKAYNLVKSKGLKFVACSDAHTPDRVGSSMTKFNGSGTPSKALLLKADREVYIQKSGTQETNNTKNVIRDIDRKAFGGLIKRGYSSIKVNMNSRKMIDWKRLI